MTAGGSVDVELPAEVERPEDVLRRAADLFDDADEYDARALLDAIEPDDLYVLLIAVLRDDADHAEHVRDRYPADAFCLKVARQILAAS